MPFSFHRQAVENLWKIIQPAENQLGLSFSTAVHMRLVAALAEKWKTAIQISLNKQVTAAFVLGPVWKSAFRFGS
jgi:hypothetical protein